MKQRWGVKGKPEHEYPRPDLDQKQFKDRMAQHMS